MALLQDARIGRDQPAGAGASAGTPSGEAFVEEFTRYVESAHAALCAWARRDAPRLALWTPVAIGLGAGVFFALKADPVSWAAPLFGLAFLVAAVRAAGPARRVFQAAALAALGFCAADLRTHAVAAPTLADELKPRLVTGALVSLGEGPSARRLVIAVETIDGLAREETPERVRINWRGARFDARPGDRIALRAGLSPPPEPVAPGAFDFARLLYFQKIGAVGYAVSPPAPLEPRRPSEDAVLSARIETLRVALARRITAAAPGPGGAIVAAVVTGKREAIPESAEEALRDSGLAHLLAISGLHMGLATGLIFFTLRAGLALVEPLALRYPIKKWAAAAALGAGLFYLLLSGGGWSARRAFIMTSVVFAAIIADRRALSLRNVAIAASIILLSTPEALFQPGFQMSFAAVTALIAAYEWSNARADPDRSFSLAARFRRYAVGVAATDTIAGLATAPFGLYHFNRAAVYSLPANLAAMPLMAFWIMPAAVVGLLLAPFGLDAPAWCLSAAGMDVVLSVSAHVSSRPGAVRFTAQWPPSALIVLTIGGLWFCLQTARWRWAGLAAAPAAALLIADARPPAIFIARAGDNVGVVAAGAGAPGLAVFDRRKSRFEQRAWREFAGLDPAGGPDGERAAALDEIARCDGYGCVVRLAPEIVLAVSSRPGDADADCARADIVVALYPVARRTFERCRARIVDRRAVWNGGAHAIWIDERTRQPTIKAVADHRGTRPWTRQPP